MIRFSTSLPLAIAAVATLGALPATAQVAGTYSGTTAGGSTVSFTVVADTSTGNFEITSVGIGFSDLCSDGSTFNSGWGFGLNQDIVARKIAAVSTNNYFTFHYNLVFSADGQSAKGYVSSVVPTLTPVGPAPKKALICRGARQSMSVTLQPPGARSPDAKDGAVWLGKPSNAAN